jgi:hypothetical protein
MIAKLVRALLAHDVVIGLEVRQLHVAVWSGS